MSGFGIPVSRPVTTAEQYDQLTIHPKEATYTTATIRNNAINANTQLVGPQPTSSAQRIVGRTGQYLRHPQHQHAGAGTEVRDLTYHIAGQGNDDTNYAKEKVPALFSNRKYGFKSL